MYRATQCAQPRLFTEHDIVGQFIFFIVLIIGKILAQYLSNFRHDMRQSLCIVLPVKMGQRQFRLFIPELITDLFMNALVAKQGQLTILCRDIDQHGIPRSDLVHFQGGKDFHCPVEGIHEPAAAFHEYAYLSAGPVFGRLDGGYDLLFFSFGKEFLFGKKWDMQGYGI